MRIPADALVWSDFSNLDPGALCMTSEGNWWLIVEYDDRGRSGRFGLALTGPRAGRLSRVTSNASGYSFGINYDWEAMVPDVRGTPGWPPEGAPLVLTTEGPGIIGTLGDNSGGLFTLGGREVGGSASRHIDAHYLEWGVQLVRSDRAAVPIAQLFTVETAGARP